MKEDRVITDTPGGLAALWRGWIAPPAWWLAQFEIRYAMVPWACRHDVRWLVPGFGVLALGVSLALTWWAGRTARRRTGEEPRSFLQTGAAWTAIFFALLVFTQLLPDLFIDPSQQ